MKKAHLTSEKLRFSKQTVSKLMADQLSGGLQSINNPDESLCGCTRRCDTPLYSWPGIPCY
ncbi:hypothetical protein [Ascidiimonas aurantiaca]|uniref:hypothetical protein n=1 Tax=Ascidiimonas aurantiaca TaxID=1685432 RepID=UPI0030EE59B7